MSAIPKRSPCPIACTLDLIGDRWTLLVIRDLMFGKRTRFDEFLSSPEDIATNVLTDRLRRLVEVGLVKRVPLPTHRSRATYELTAAGESLRPVLTALRDWGLAHIAGTSVEKARAEAIARATAKQRPGRVRR